MFMNAFNKLWCYNNKIYAYVAVFVRVGIASLVILYGIGSKIPICENAKALKWDAIVFHISYDSFVYNFFQVGSYYAIWVVLKLFQLELVIPLFQPPRLQICTTAPGWWPKGIIYRLYEYELKLCLCGIEYKIRSP